MNRAPLVYIDSSGHIPIPLIIGAGLLVLKAVDYGWTAWDAYQSGRTLFDPSASRSDRLLAGLNVTLAIGLEAIEPDDLLPTGLPLDDVARKALVKGAREALEEGGEEALERFIRDNLGEHADDVLKHIDEVLEGSAKAGSLKAIKVKRLENLGVDAHAVKKALLGSKAPISKWDIALDTDTGLYWLVSKDPTVPPQLIGALEELVQLSEP